MKFIEGGTYSMGSDHHYPEHAPAHGVTVRGFWMESTPVTNREYRRFTEATGYLTLAERASDPKEYLGALPHMLEAEWNYAACGRLDGAEFTWGDDSAPDGLHMANTRQGDLPHENRVQDGFSRTSPVRALPANGYGPSDMIGNVLEWTSDWYADRHEAAESAPCCIPVDPSGARETASYDRATDTVRILRKVVKGGSHLCVSHYCHRYRPAACHAQPLDSGMSHLGFRCVARP